MSRQGSGAEASMLAALEEEMFAEKSNHLFFGDCAVGFTRTLTFTMRNQSQKDCYRFAWPIPPEAPAPTGPVVGGGAPGQRRSHRWHHCCCRRRRRSRSPRCPSGALPLLAGGGPPARGLLEGRERHLLERSAALRSRTATGRQTQQDSILSRSRQGILRLRF